MSAIAKPNHEVVYSRIEVDCSHKRRDDHEIACDSDNANTAAHKHPNH